MAYLLLLLWIVVIVGESRVSGRIWSGMLGKAFFVLAFPGILVHELSHVIGCLIMGAKVTNLSLFEPQGGYVTHGEPKIPIIGKPVISFAPLFGCGLALWLVYTASPFQFGPLQTPVGAPGLLTLEFTASGLREFGWSVWDVIKQFFVAIPKLNFHSVWTYVFAYLALSIGIAFSPSKQDFGNAAMSLVICIALLFVADIVAVALGHVNGLENFIIPPTIPLLGFALGMMTFLMTVSLFFWGLHKLVDLAMRSETKGKGAGAKGPKNGKQGKEGKEKEG